MAFTVVSVNFSSLPHWVIDKRGTCVAAFRTREQAEFSALALRSRA